jgi:hypothetical protein
MVNWARRRKKENLQNVLYHSVAVSLHSLSHSVCRCIPCLCITNLFSSDLCLFLKISSRFTILSPIRVDSLLLCLFLFRGSPSFQGYQNEGRELVSVFFVESRLIILVLVTIPILFQLILVLILLRRTGCTDQFSRYCTDVLSTTNRGYSTQEEYEELVVEAGTTSTTNSSYSSSSSAPQQRRACARSTRTHPRSARLCSVAQPAGAAPPPPPRRRPWRRGAQAGAAAAVLSQLFASQQEASGRAESGRRRRAAAATGAPRASAGEERASSCAGAHATS